MLTEICGYLNNYFDVERHKGDIKIQSGVIYCNEKQINIESGQHFALFRKNFVVGVYKYGTDTLSDKEFIGAVWLMDVPQAVTSLVNEIKAWQDKYGGADSAANSPFQSESFGGYSYSKGSSSSGGSAITWRDMFGSRLSQYKKVSLL